MSIKVSQEVWNNSPARKLLLAIADENKEDIIIKRKKFKIHKYQVMIYNNEYFNILEESSFRFKFFALRWLKKQLIAHCASDAKGSLSIFDKKKDDFIIQDYILTMKHNLFKLTKDSSYNIEKKDKRTFKQKWCYFWKYGLKEKYLDSAFHRHITSAIVHPKNFFFCLKYPFWKARNVWSGRFMGYHTTWYDDICSGWKIAFGKQLSEDILKAGKETRKRLHKHCSWKNMLHWEQIKEKWGELCLYASSSIEIENVLDRYEHISQAYCIRCGKPARYLVTGWVHFACEDCFKEELQYAKEQYGLSDEAIAKDLKECRLTKKDLPNMSRYEYKVVRTENFDSEEACCKRQDELYDANVKNMTYTREQLEDGTWKLEHTKSIEHKVDFKKEYNIDLEEMWGLK